ncbi:P-loop containing nucleoside triphosphate hydrolase protein [Coniophora puteana RWD-64-598 SS2]|uniref:Midasin n=1 Tax=Coniophora puteana (strain RWD-64-598) TaxID=741705 RepID=R7SFT8_CONPW|nr:P-loop containing nucleoside triphosphate hydrolase protein [Coniophora puteana RWD-64-598 SS2]EIW74720.1 P-loop containing nucleoside triphosphate hydrolase protein [Coniophora puteana RWD-64-598 SS2]
MLSFAAVALALASSVIAAPADTRDVHTITFNNNCGYGNPVWNTPSNATKNGAGNGWAAVVSGVARLDVDGCGSHGENCTVVEFTLDNPSLVVWTLTVAKLGYAGTERLIRCIAPSCCAKNHIKPEVAGNMIRLFDGAPRCDRNQTSRAKDKLQGIQHEREKTQYVCMKGDDLKLTNGIFGSRTLAMSQTVNLTAADPLQINLARQTRTLLSHILQNSHYASSIEQGASSTTQLLVTLSRLLANPSLTTHITQCFRPLLLDLSARWLEDDEDLEDRFRALAFLIQPHEELYPVLFAFLQKPQLADGPLPLLADAPSIPQIKAARLHALLIAYYRVLQANRLLPKHLFWSIDHLSALFTTPHPDRGVQLLAIRCYALQAGMVERERQALETRVLGAPFESDCPIVCGQDAEGAPVVMDGWLFPALEAKRVVDARNASVENSNEFYIVDEVHTTSALGPLRNDDLSSYTANIHGVLLLKSNPLPIQHADIVMTPTAQNALRSLAIHRSLRLPVLISSPPSSGKSLLLTYLSAALHPTQKDNIVTIYLADTSLDARSLLGSYVSSVTQPGTFEWKDGVLVRAMKEGKWLLLKDIDRTSSDVLGLVRPLAESMGPGNWIGARATLDVPGRGEVVAAEGFALFASRSTIPLRNGAMPAPGFHGAHKFAEIVVDVPTPEEVRMIVDEKYPRLAGVLAQALIRMWADVQRLGYTASSRPVGLRDLEQLCRRINHILPSNHSSSSMDVDMDAGGEVAPLQDIFPNPTFREDMFAEARDVLFGAGASTSAARAHRDQVAAVVALHLGLDDERRDWILTGRTPEFDVEKDVNGETVAVRAGYTRLRARPAKPGSASASLAAAAAKRPFAMHKPAIGLMARIATAVSLAEPVLLTGETGTGKTTVVTHLAGTLRRPLVALNLSHQTESADLLGGFKPVDARVPGAVLCERFGELFGVTFSRRKNEKFEEGVRRAVREGKWKRAVVLWRESVRLARERIRAKRVEGNVGGEEREAVPNGLNDGAPRKRRKVEQASLEASEAAWADFEKDVDDFDIQHVQGKGKLAFNFVEGPLVKALRNGDWVLLDEINLASPETLECIYALLKGPTASITLTEQGSLDPVIRHPDFRLFACMNPATDVGKKDLPPNIRARFTEIDVPPPDADRETLLGIVAQYIGASAVGDKAAILNIAEFYTGVKALSEARELADTANHRPHYSMRTLARALTFAADIAPTYSLRRALWEACLMAFTMVLDVRSAAVVTELAQRHILAGVRNPRSLLAREPAPPQTRQGEAYIKFGPFYLQKGPLPEDLVEEYIMTPSVEKKLIDLARIILTRRFPVLIEGPTSAGKTSAIEYLARRTGHQFIRINNHEHTDIQEYIGSYVSDPATGKLVFKDGLLVHALRHGHWIVLDELNLAPTDVLEALNRLLDDNRELLVPETQEVIRPHPHFMLFATQNPPGLYAGRKVLSRAFRNRFLEVHFEDVPQAELETILCERCRIAPSYGQKIVAVFRELQQRRQGSRVFESKQGFATLRDLFRWAGRDAVGYQELAENGYMLLAERTRRLEDKTVVKEVIESIMKVRIDENVLYDLGGRTFEFLGCPVPSGGEHKVVWTGAMQRLYTLVARAMRFNEPVLLVGETGSGKTSVCQLYAEALGKRLYTVSCHQNTETADLIGGLRPVRGRREAEFNAVGDATAVLGRAGLALQGAELGPGDVEEVQVAIGKALKSLTGAGKGADPDLIQELRAIQGDLRRLASLFEWNDGPLVSAMQQGDVFLLDEISLADDSVLERLNSVLEPSRSIVLAERGGADSLEHPTIKAAGDFKLLATMNPGGDYGKKELSPALRNRFTEIWVPSVDQGKDLEVIVASSWKGDEFKTITGPLLAFTSWFREKVDVSACTLRDILAWVNFSNVMHERDSKMPLEAIFHHAARMTLIDGMNSLPQLAHCHRDTLLQLNTEADKKLHELAPFSDTQAHGTYPPDRYVQFGPFAIPRGKEVPTVSRFSLEAPTSQENASRVVRACQVPKPVLLEGSPGVGKTSLITALANIAGYRLCRINLSDQTDLTDLFGSDLPVENGKPGEFAWKDAEFLNALQEGHWVLLDEMNLAPQAILEGLNAVLDHRGTVYIPELGRSFVRHPEFRVFAAQNPLNQGGGRKGLPRSFVDRFTKVYLNDLTPDDLLLISRGIFQDQGHDEDVLRAMIQYNSTINDEVVLRRSFAREGSPWEFNLRDVIRWGELLRASGGLAGDAESHIRTLYLSRFRTSVDREAAAALARVVFPVMGDHQIRPHLLVSPTHLAVGEWNLARGNMSSSVKPSNVYQARLPSLETMAACVSQSWLVILTGKHGSGKTGMVRALANSTGNLLWELTINSATDTMDLLGSFEQVDGRAHITALAQEVLTFTERLMCQSHGAAGRYSRYYILLRHLQSITSLAPVIMEQASELLQDLAPMAEGSPALTLEYEQLFNKVKRHLVSNASTGRFEWVDGPLVRAIKEGHWIVLEGANLCNPSVLDRLNSLCEPNGVLMLSERGFVDGTVQVLKPHPNFRLFMTVDPQYGELSRAMRNRGVEVALLDRFTPEDEQRYLDDMRWPRSLELDSRASPTNCEVLRRGLHIVATTESHSYSQTWPSGMPVEQDMASSSLLTIAPFFDRLSTSDVRATLRFFTRTLPPAYRLVWLRYLAGFDFGPAGQIISNALRQLDVSVFSAARSNLRESTGPNGKHESSVVGIMVRDYCCYTIGSALDIGGMYSSYYGLQPLDNFMVLPSNTPDLRERDIHLMILQALNLYCAIISYEMNTSRRTSSKPPQQRSALERIVNASSSVLNEIRDASIVVLRNFSERIYSQPDLDLAVSLLSYAEHLKKAADGAQINYSYVLTLAKWIHQALQTSSITFSRVLQESDALQSAMILSTGQGLAEIWTNLLLPRRGLSRETLERLEAAARTFKTPSASIDARKKVFDVMCLGTLPQAPSTEEEENMLVLASKLLQASEDSGLSGDVLPSEGTTLSLELATLATTYNGLTTASRQLLRDILRAAYRDQSGGLVRFVSYQHAIWASEVGLVSHAVLSRAHCYWLQALLDYTFEYDSALNGPSVLLHPVNLKVTQKMSQWTRITIGSLPSYEVSLGRFADIILCHCEIDTTRVQQLVGFLRQSILMASSSFAASYDEGYLENLSSCRSQGNPIELASLVTALQKTSHEAFSQNLRAIMEPAVNRLVIDSASSKAIKELGRCFVALNKLLIETYVPNIPLDPAAVLECSVEFWGDEEVLLAEQLDLHTLHEKRVTGNDQNPVTRYMEAALENVRQRLSSFSVPVTRRSERQRVATFWAEYQQFHSQVVSGAGVTAIVSSDGPWDSSLNMREEVIQESIATFLQRMEESYPEFEDIFYPMKLALQYLRLGLRLIRSSSSDDSNFSHSRLVENLLQFPSMLSSQLLASQREVVAGPKSSVSLSDQVILQLSSVSLLSAVQRVGGHVKDVEVLYERISALWKLDCARREKAEAQSLYRVAEHAMVNDEDEEANEVLALFPTYEADNEDAMSPEQQETSKVSQLLSPSHIHTLCRLHISLFGDRNLSQSEALKDFLGFAQGVVDSELNSNLPAFSEALDHQSLPFQILRLQHLLDGLHMNSSQAPNFYRDSNVYEARKALKAVETLDSRLVELIAEWPDQMVLQHLRERCQAVLQLHLDSPVAKILSVVEALLIQTDDWEMYAHRNNSLKEYQHTFMNLIVDWRRLELSNWRALLQSQYESFCDGVSTFWFNLYDVAIRSPLASTEEDFPTFIAQLPSLLDQFIASSPIGQFEARMELLRSFISFVHCLAGTKQAPERTYLHRVGCVLHSTWTYYDLFSSALSQSFSKKKAALEKEVQDLIKLASWKDVNVHALKQSAQRTHHNLYKIIRKFRELMRQPTSDQMSLVLAGDSEGSLLRSDVGVRDEGIITYPIPKSPTFPPVTHGVLSQLKDISHTFSRFSNFIETSIRPAFNQTTADVADELAVNIIVISKELAATPIPGDLSKEKKEKFSKALLVRKRKAWSDLLKELRRGGFATGIKPQVAEQLRNEGWVREQPILDSKWSFSVDKSEYYFTRLRGVLPSFRNLLSDHHTDINTRELQRALALLESGYSFALDSRRCLAGSIHDFCQVSDITRRLYALSTEGSVIIDGPALQALSTSLRSAVVSLEEVVEGSRAYFALQQDRISLSEAAEQSLQELRSQGTRCIEEIDPVVRIQGSLPFVDRILPSEREIADKALDYLRSLPSALVKVSVEEPRLKYLLDPVVCWLQTLEMPSTLYPINNHVLDKEQTGEEVINIMLVNVQILLAQRPPPTKESDDGQPEDNYIRDGLRVATDSVRCLSLDKIQSALSALFVAHAGQPFEIMRPVLNRILPFLHIYLTFAQERIIAQIRWVTVLFKLLFVLCSIMHTVAKQGFCRPPDLEEGGEGEDAGEVTGGVGLGEGAGSKNVSKEIEDESQVEGLQGEDEAEQPEDKDKEAGGKDDTIEMSEDFGGELEDVPDEEDEEGEADEKEDEDEGPEEKAEDLDPTDPSAVDEKLWNGESGPEDKEQDQLGEDNNQQEGKDSDVVAKEDEKSKKSKDKEQKEGQANEEEKDAPEAPEEEQSAGEQEEDLPDGEAPNESGAPMDEHVPDANALDLPDDMNLDQQEQEDHGDMDMEDDLQDDEDAMSDQAPEDADTQGMDADSPAPDEPVPEDAPADGAPQATADDAEEPPEDDAPEDAVAQPDLTAGGGDPSQADNRQQLEAAQQGESTGANRGSDAKDEAEERPEAGCVRFFRIYDPPLLTPDISEQESGPQEHQPEPTGGDTSGSNADGVERGHEYRQQNRELANNPLRNLGDALKEVQQRFQDILESEEGAPKPSVEEKPDGTIEQVEYADEADEDMQALGPSEDAQVTKLSELKLVEEDSAQQPPMAPMDVDPALPEPEKQPPVNQMHSEPTAERLQPDIEGAISQMNPREMDGTRHVPTLPDSTSIKADQDLEDDPTTQAQQETVELALREWQSSGQPSQGAEQIWRLYESLTHDLSYALCEQLRLILEPTLATRLKGDYRTGKRLNMKKIIPYIASDYTKDKIWLRRTRPSQREYQVLIALDDSRSMAESHSVHLAYQTLALVSKALSRLEVGDIAIAKFGESVDVLHAFDPAAASGGGPFTDQAGVKLVSAFKFDQKATDVLAMLETSLRVLEEARERRAMSSQSAADLWQLEIIISDGICQDHEKVRTTLRKAAGQRVMVVFVIIDSLHSHVDKSSAAGAAAAAASQAQNSILSMSQVGYKMVDGRMELQMERYLDSFPFEYYVVLRGVEALPEVLSSTLRQFFERISEE